MTNMPSAQPNGKLSASSKVARKTTLNRGGNTCKKPTDPKLVRGTQP